MASDYKGRKRTQDQSSDDAEVTAPGNVQTAPTPATIIPVVPVIAPIPFSEPIPGRPAPIPISAAPIPISAAPIPISAAPIPIQTAPYHAPYVRAPIPPVLGCKKGDILVPNALSLFLIKCSYDFPTYSTPNKIEYKYIE